MPTLRKLTDGFGNKLASSTGKLELPAGFEGNKKEDIEYTSVRDFIKGVYQKARSLIEYFKDPIKNN